MKHFSEVVCCVVDYGPFIPLSRRLAESYAKTYYYSPIEEQFLDIRKCMVGSGFEKLERLNDIFEPDVFDEIDLFVFPDINYGGLQKHLRDLGKSVWGSLGACELERSRTLFLETIKEVGLSTPPYIVIEGLTKLTEYLKTHENKFIKVDEFRGNMETWYHQSWEYSQFIIAEYEVLFGPYKDTLTFVVQDKIDTDIEIGYDGWSIDGKTPPQTFSGYENKNEAYLGVLKKNEDLPKQILEVNKKFLPILAQYGYRNFFASEIRVKGKDFYFIDPTCRSPALTSEHHLRNCKNLADVIWQGANGIVIKPEYEFMFAGEINVYSKSKEDSWKVVEVPKEVEDWFNPTIAGRIKGLTCVAPSTNTELGYLVALGNTIKEVANKLDKYINYFKNEPVNINYNSFLELIPKVEKAEKAGLEFTEQTIPKPQTLWK